MYVHGQRIMSMRWEIVLLGFFNDTQYPPKKSTQYIHY